MTSIRCRILVRTDINWHEMSDEAFANQTDPTRPRLFIHGAVKHDLPGTFRRTFGVDFFRYRGELQRIARRSLLGVANARVSVGFDDFETWFENDEEEFVFPIDDDDLFAPSLATVLKHVEDDTAVILWPHVMAGFVDFHHAATGTCRMFPILFSNNWGVRKSFLRAHLAAPQAKDFLAHHHVAQSQIVRLLGVDATVTWEASMRHFVPLMHPRVKRVLECMGVDYMHVGSLNLFSTLVTRGQLASLENYDPAAPIALPECAGWAASYVDEMTETIPRLRRGG